MVNLLGEVIAVTMPILPGFDGSNLGVPIDEVRKILPAAATDTETDEAYPPVADYPAP